MVLGLLPDVAYAQSEPQRYQGDLNDIVPEAGGDMVIRKPKTIEMRGASEDLVKQGKPVGVLDDDEDLPWLKANNSEGGEGAAGEGNGNTGLLKPLVQLHFVDITIQSITIEQRQKLNAVIDMLHDNAEMRVQIVSYSQSFDAEKIDRARHFSLKRALAVRKYIISKGNIRRERLVLRALGDTVTDKQQNMIEIEKL